MDFVRVSKNFPCPVCGREKYCTIWENGHVVFCPRTANDDYRAPWGYRHELEFPVDIEGQRIAHEEENQINWGLLSHFYQNEYKCEDIEDIFVDKNLDCLDSVAMSFGVGWDGEAYTIPMWKDGQVCGIQRRFPDGHKSCIPGGKNGIFVPSTRMSVPRILVICEGASDAIYVAAYNQHEQDMLVVGRQNCTDNENILAFMQALGIYQIIIIADNDEPGLSGAKQLKDALDKPYDVHIFVPELKDARDTITELGSLKGRWI